MLTRRSTLAIPLAFAAAGPALADSGAPPVAIVLNSGEGTVSVIDTATRQVIGTEPAYREPSHWALTPDRQRLLVADASGNALFIYDPRTGATMGHKRIADPYQIGYTPNNRYFVVNALRLDFVDVYDGADFSLVKRFKPGRWPSHLDFSPDSRWSFNSMQNSDTLCSFDLVNMTQRWSVKVGTTPAGVLWLNGRIIVCLMGEGGIVEVDPIRGGITHFQKTGDGAHNIFLDERRHILYVSNRGPGQTSLTALDPVTLKPMRTYPIPGGPDDIAIDPEGNIWIAQRFAESVAVLDPQTGEYSTIPVGRSPHGIFLSSMLRQQGQVTAERLL